MIFGEVSLSCCWSSYIPPSVYTSLPPLTIILDLFRSSSPKRQRALSPVVFTFLSLVIIVIEHFLYTHWPVVCFPLSNVYFSVGLLTVLLELSFLHILNINASPYILYEKHDYTIFFYFIDYLFISLLLCCTLFYFQSKPVCSFFFFACTLTVISRNASVIL